MKAFAEFIRTAKSFTGSPTELAQAVADSTCQTFSAAALSKKLLQSKTELERLGIEYASKCSNSKRIVIAAYSDGSDGSYGKNDIPHIPKLPSLLSLP